MIKKIEGRLIKIVTNPHKMIGLNELRLKIMLPGRC
jgi:hypothetical protein